MIRSFVLTAVCVFAGSVGAAYAQQSPADACHLDQYASGNVSSAFEVSSVKLVASFNGTSRCAVAVVAKPQIGELADRYFAAAQLASRKNERTCAVTEAEVVQKLVQGLVTTFDVTDGRQFAYVGDTDFAFLKVIREGQLSQRSAGLMETAALPDDKLWSGLLADCKRADDVRTANEIEAGNRARLAKEKAAEEAEEERQRAEDEAQRAKQQALAEQTTERSLTAKQAAVVAEQVASCLNVPPGSSTDNITGIVKFALTADGYIHGQPAVLGLADRNLGSAISRAVMRCGPYELPSAGIYSIPISPMLIW